MTPTEILRRVAALELEPDAMREVINIIADIQAVDDARRAKQRDRMRERRARTVSEQCDNCDDTVHATVPLVSPSSPPKKVSPITPSKNTPPPTPSGIHHAREAFEDLRRAFPKRKGRDPRKPALRSFEAALSRGATVEEIRAGANRYREQAIEEKIVGTPYVPQLVTWLNQEGWRDFEARPTTAMRLLQPGSEEWKAEREAKVARGESTALMDRQAERGVGWAVTEQTEAA